MYTAEDFNTENAPKEMVQYIIDNVDDFEPRYQHALKIIGRNRCPLRMADYALFSCIRAAMEEWTRENDIFGEGYDDSDIEEIFG